MADEPTLEERREQDHERTEPEAGEPPEMGPLHGIGNFLLPREEPVEPRRLGSSTRFVSGDGRSQSIGEFLRQYGRNLPDRFRERLALMSFSHVLEGSVLGECIDDDLLRPPGRRAAAKMLPPETRIVLESALMLQSFGMSPDDYRQLRDGLRTAREALEVWSGISAPSDDPDLERYWTVDQELGALENLVRYVERFIQRLGYRWNWDSRTLELPPRSDGGRPRQVLRDLVRTLLLHYGFANNTAEVREKIASELAPFFSAGLLDTSKGSSLYNAVDHSLPTP